MIWAILIFAILNLSFGFTLAVALEQAPRVRSRWEAWRKRRAAALAQQREIQPVIAGPVAVAPLPPASVTPPSAAQLPAPPMPAAPLPIPIAPANLDAEPVLEPDAELPTDWLAALETEAPEAGNFVEASVQVLRLEVGHYRSRLLGVDDLLRTFDSPPTADDLQAIAHELCKVNQDWLHKQADAAAHLSDRRGSLGAFEGAALELENVLLDQAAQIETTLSNLSTLTIAADIDEAGKQLKRELCRLIDLAHTLRDRMSDSLVAIMAAEKKIHTLERKFQLDGLTGLLNRFGLEFLLEQWWRDDPARQRLVSCVQVDLDRISKLNDRHGARQIDSLLAGVARWIDAQVRRDRGCDCAVRLSGQSFLLFLGDTGARSAASAAERIRQNLKVTTFELDEEPFDLTASFAVAEIQKADNSVTLLSRLSQLVQQAKRSGRDRSILDEGSGPTPVEPPNFQARARTVHLDA
jgi:diguanylate cyclase (GGDEF)-like protein